MAFSSIKDSKAINKVRTAGQRLSVQLGLVFIQALPKSSATELTVVPSKKHFKLATDRNFIRRQVKSYFYDNTELLDTLTKQPARVLIVINPRYNPENYHAYKKELTKKITLWSTSQAHNQAQPQVHKVKHL